MLSEVVGNRGWSEFRGVNLAESSLRYRENRHPARRDSKPANRKLTDTEETALVQWILSIDQRGLPLRTTTIRQMADLLLAKRSASIEQPALKVRKS
jgi:hypothetical protein